MGEVAAAAAAAAAQAIANHSSVKVRTLDSDGSLEWLDWRTHFETSQVINAWNHRRARLEIKRAMAGLALRAVRHIDIGVAGVPAADVENFTDLLDQYEACFVTAQASQHALAALDDARQQEDETITSWVSRLRFLYRRAHPNEEGEQNNQTLIRMFIKGIRDMRVQEKAYDLAGEDFDSAIAAAHKAVESVSRMSNRMQQSGYIAGLDNGGASTSTSHRPTIAAADTGVLQVGGLRRGAGAGRQGRASSSGSCYHCGKPGHQRTDCREFAKLARSIGFTPQDLARKIRDTQRKSGRGNRRGRARGGARGGFRRGLGALTYGSDLDGLDDGMQDDDDADADPDTETYDDNHVGDDDWAAGN